MPRLPGTQDLNARPVPQAQMAQANQGLMSSAAAQNVATAQGAARVAGQGMGAISQVGMDIAERIHAADQRIRTRDDAIERARAISTFNDDATAEFDRAQTEEDFSSRDVADRYIKKLGEMQDRLLSNHGGSEDSKAALAVRLEGMRGEYSRRAAEARLQAQRDLVGRTLNKGFSGLAASAYEAPSKMVELLDSANGQIDDLAPALSPDEEAAARVVAREQIVLSSVQSLMDRGDYREARNVMMTLPPDYLSPQKRLTVEARISQAESAEADAAKAGRRKAAELEAFLGRPLTPEERQKAAGLAPQNEVPTDLQKNLISAGLMPGTPEYQQAVIAAVAKPLVRIDQNKPFGADQAAARQNEAVQGIGIAASTKALTTRLGNFLVQGAQTGPLEAGKAIVRSIAQDLGVRVDEAALGRAQEFDRISNDLTLNSMQRFKGAMSNKELDFGISTVSGLGRSEDGNIRAIAALQAASEIALENNSQLQAAGSVEEYKAVEARIAKRSADELVQRTEEIETELRAKIASGRATPTKETFEAMTPDQARAYVQRADRKDLEALGQDMLIILDQKLSQP